MNFNIDLHPHTRAAYKLLHAGTLAFANAEYQGIRIDLDYVKVQKRKLAKKIRKLEQGIEKSSFFKEWKRSIRKTPNIYSQIQLAIFLYDVKRLKPEKTTPSGQGSTDDETLSALNIPEINDLLQIKKLKKLRDTYLDGFLKHTVDGFMHPNFNLHLVRTYRSSSDKPNFQNYPKRDEESMKIIRGAIYPRIGNQLLEADFGSLEVRIAACYHKDPMMMKYIKDPTTDMHTDMATQLFLVDKFNKKLPEHYHLRQAAKNGFVFPEFYGDYYKNCAESLACKWGEMPKSRWKVHQGVSMPDGTLGQHFISKGIHSLDNYIKHVQNIETNFWGVRFKEYARWKVKWWKEYQRNGYIDMLTGFRCSGVMSNNDAINYPVQGAAFHCLLWCFTELDKIMRKEKWKSRLIGQIHDSVIFDLYPAEKDHVLETIKRITTIELPKYWPWIIVPLEIDADLFEIDQSWASKSSQVVFN